MAATKTRIHVIKTMQTLGYMSHASKNMRKESSTMRANDLLSKKSTCDIKLVKTQNLKRNVI